MPTALYDFLFWVGGAVCHQLPERSLVSGGRPLPLCARCTGIYLSVFVWVAGLCVAGFVGRLTKTLPRMRDGGPRGIIMAGSMAALFLVPMEIDGLGNLLRLWGSSALIRILTGSAFGFGLPVFFILLMRFDSQTARVRWPAGSFCLLPLLGVVSLSGAWAVYRGWITGGGWIGAVSITGLVMALTAVGVMLCVKVFHMRGRWGGAAAFAAAWGYIGLANAIRAQWM